MSGCNRVDIKKALFSEGFRVIQTCFRYRTHLSAGWRLSPYPAYEKLQYQTVTQISVSPRKQRRRAIPEDCA
ncbi:hypothetical protein KQQSB11_350092 [Klebsiella quasipneumoniae subsp. quasipneumoniae]|nr:hypothetical protein KQQSB11_350092 [Klebsiella quasipneumoniae subsp. quasipneumoniae]